MTLKVIKKIIALTLAAALVISVYPISGSMNSVTAYADDQEESTAVSEPTGKAAENFSADTATDQTAAAADTETPMEQTDAGKGAETPADQTPAAGETEEPEEPEIVTGIITSVKNVNTGIRVYWSIDETKSGYIIYKKDKSKSSSTWKKVRTIKDPTRSSWLDKSVKNGTRYLYRVRSFDDTGITKSREYLSIRRLSRPEIKKVTTADINRIHIRGNRNTKATGFQVKISLNSNFTDEKIVSFNGNRLDADITGLKSATRYYFRIRAYTVNGSKTYYSNWSKWRSKKTKDPYDAYTTGNWTFLYKGASASTSFVKIWYNSKIRILDYAKERAKGDWLKVDYSGSIYYLWVPKDSELFSVNRNEYDYIKDTNTKFENEVLEKAMGCFRNWNMKYDYTHRAAHGVPDTDGMYPFDCSNYAAYVLNSVMQKYCPAYLLSSSVLIQSQMDIFLNEGLKGEFNIKNVCEGKLDRNALRPGDLLFFKTDPTDDRVVDHVGIYMGGDDMMHSVKNYERYPGDTLGGVCIAPLKGYNESTFMYALRMIPDKFESAELPMTVIKKTAVYPNARCKSGTKIDTIDKGTAVTVIYTLNREFTDSDGDISSVVNAYIRYGSGKYGFIYEYNEKLEEPDL